jgi:hypothetical protein
VFVFGFVLRRSFFTLVSVGVVSSGRFVPCLAGSGAEAELDEMSARSEEKREEVVSDREGAG